MEFSVVNRRRPSRETPLASGEAVRQLVKSRVQFPSAQIRGAFLIMRSPMDANFGWADSTETSMLQCTYGQKGLFRFWYLYNI